MDVPMLQNELADTADVSTLIRKRVEVAMKMLALGDTAAKTNIDLAIQVCDRVKHELIAEREKMSCH